MTDRWTWHGGGLNAARACFGDGRQPWVDLSTGINPHAWPVPELDIDWARLPDDNDLHALEAAAADRFGIDPAFVCAVPGTEIGLRLAGSLLPGPAWHLAPSYRTHGEMLDGIRPVSWNMIGDVDGATLILANPNNPDGRVQTRATLLDLSARRGTQGWLLVDEAFADVEPTVSIAGDIAPDRRLLAFRSFGKYFGLAGVRLGFVLGPPAFLADIRARLGAWPLSAAAIAIGIRAYRDRAWIVAMRARLMAEAAVLDAMLVRAGLQTSGACPLFRLVEADDAQTLFTHLARRAILTRPFADNPRWLRFGLPLPDALTRLEEALHDR